MALLKLARCQLAITTLYHSIFVAVTIGIAGPERQNPTPSLGGKPAASTDTPHAPAVDDEEDRRVGLLLLGKGTVSAHRFDWPRVAGLDDDQQS